MEKIFTVDYFISKFSAIPEDRWAVLNYCKDDKHCALGHCGVVSGYATDEADALSNLFRIHLRSVTVVDVNDFDNAPYEQPTPKERILAALRDIKKLSSEPDVQECDATKIIVAPSAWPNKQSSLTNLIPIVDEVSDLKNVNQIQGLSGSKK